MLFALGRFHVVWTRYVGSRIRTTLFWRRWHAAGMQFSWLSVMNVYELLFYNLSCFCHGAAELCTSPLDFYLAWGFWDETASRLHGCKYLGESGTRWTRVNASASPINSIKEEIFERVTEYTGKPNNRRGQMLPFCSCWQVVEVLGLDS